MCTLTSPYNPPIATNQKEAHRATKLPDSITGLLTASLRLSLKQCKGKESRSYYLFPSSPTPDCPDCEPSPYISTHHSWWGDMVLVFPSLPAEKKNHISISSELCLHTPYFFYLTLLGRENEGFSQRHSSLGNQQKPRTDSPWLLWARAHPQASHCVLGTGESEGPSWAKSTPRGSQAASPESPLPMSRTTVATASRREVPALAEKTHRYPFVMSPAPAPFLIC